MMLKTIVMLAAVAVISPTCTKEHEKQMDFLKEIMIDVRTDLRRLKKTVHGIDLRVGQLETNSKGTISKVDGIDRRLEGVSRDIESIKNDYGHVHNEVDGISSKVDRIDEKLGKVSNDVESAEIKSSQLHSTVNETISKVDRIDGKLGKVSDNLGSVKNDFGQLRSRVDGISSKVDGIDGRMGPLAIDVKSVKKGFGGVPFSSCTGDVITVTGTDIKYPRQGKYRKNENCVWTVSAGDNVRVAFTKFDLEMNDHDYVEVRKNDQRIGAWSGHDIPSDEIVLNGDFTVHFVSDGDVDFTGFHIELQRDEDLN